MAIPIPSPLIEFVLFGPLDDRRQLQDSPILGDVWIAFGQKPEGRQDLLIVPYRTAHPGEVAGMIEGALRDSHETENATSDDAPLTWEKLEKEATKVESTDSVEGRSVAYIQGLVVARLTFFEMLSIVAPKTRWWISGCSEEDKEEPDGSGDPSTNGVKQNHAAQRYIETADEVIGRMLTQAKAWKARTLLKDFAAEHPDKLKPFSSFERFLTLMGLILWAGKHEPPPDLPDEEQIKHILEKAKPTEIKQFLDNLISRMLAERVRDPLVWQVSLNRLALPALSRSVPAVKADAAKTLFNVDCSSIGWAVIDSGIHGSHPAFMKDGVSRVKKSFNFKNFRRIVSLSNERSGERRKNLAILLHQDGLLITESIRQGIRRFQDAEKEVAVATANREDAEKIEAEARLKAIREANAKQEAKIINEADQDLISLAADARRKGPIHWELVEKFVAIDPATEPQTNHGTHVAGIIGASKDAAAKAANAAVEAAAKEAREAAQKADHAAARLAPVSGETAVKEVQETAQKAAQAKAKSAQLAAENRMRPADYFVDGMCPDISLYDFRVLGPSIKETEFAIIAALQFIRHLNERDALFTIHGANLSLSIPHDVRNFACGRTPICGECERLAASGVVVVTAAGNHGYKSFQTADGSYDSYAAFSITDPGNAENVLTVGATHRFWPHTYGVSFFSSRGPTGDGRIKPDLVAPGERIHSTFPNNEWGELDGTSMAAPHVSGAAAMLLARYSELIGQPMRVKRILCDSATDLGRERSFQGRGMLDVLRSFQSI
jgi:serine protease AprX